MKSLCHHAGARLNIETGEYICNYCHAPCEVKCMSQYDKARETRVRNKLKKYRAGGHRAGGFDEPNDPRID